MNMNNINHSMHTSTTPSGMENMGNMGNMHNHHNHGMPGMENDTDRTCAGDMLMFFHDGKCEYILFEDLRTKDVGGLVGACVCIFALAILYEGLKVFREHLLQKSMVSSSKYATANGSTPQDAMVISNKNVGPVNSKDMQLKASNWVHMMSGGHFFQTLLHMIQVFISYCLMLVFMTYNVWLCLSVVVGAGVGYFLFGWRKAIVVDINEHCH